MRGTARNAPWSAYASLARFCQRPESSCVPAFDGRARWAGAAILAFLATAPSLATPMHAGGDAAATTHAQASASGAASPDAGTEIRARLAAATAALDEWTLLACSTGQEPAALAEALGGDGPGEWALRLASLVDAAAAAAALAGGDAIWSDSDLLSCVRRAAIPCDATARQALIRALDELAMSAPSAHHSARFAALACRLAEPLLGDRDGRAARGASALGSIERRLEFIGAATGAHPEALVRQLAARARALAPGSRAPAFVSRDTDGNEVRSDSFLGQIVVYRFWDDDCAASIAAHEHDLALLRRHWNSPVELVGVTRNPNREQHLQRLEQTRVGGTQVFEGPISTHLADALARRTDLRPLAVDCETEVRGARAAFIEPGAGSLVVVDSRGIVRGRDLSHRELDQLLVSLIAEHRASLRGRIVAAPRQSASAGR